jgi:hypothetical protein
MSPLVDVRLDGVEQAEQKLRREVLIDPAVRSGAGEVLQQGQAVLAAAAPRSNTRHSGRLAASITPQLDAQPTGTLGRIVVTARSDSRKYPGGYQYGRWLQYAPKSPRRGWFTSAIPRVAEVLDRALARIGQRIEAIWTQ